MTVKTNNYVIIDRKQNVENRKSDEVSGRNIAQETNNSIHVECSGDLYDYYRSSMFCVFEFVLIHLLK